MKSASSSAVSAVAHATDPLTVSGVLLLLRSPRLSVSQVLELMDIGDAEFRQLCHEHPRIGQLLEARRHGRLQAQSAEPACCPVCGSWFLPYAGSRQCSDECREIVRLERASRKQKHA
jgi:hypothetical protein